MNGMKQQEREVKIALDVQADDVSKVGYNHIQYLICTTPRAGSNLLFSLLENAGIASRGPAEKMNQRRVNDVEAKRGWNETDLSEFIKEIFDSSVTSSGVAGFKVHRRQIEHLVGILNNTNRYRGLSAWNIKSYFPSSLKYIYLVRKDRVSQAVSYVRATQTGIWEIRKGEGKKISGALYFDFERIFDAIIQFQKWEKGWEEFFRKNNIIPLKIEYEELIKDHRGTLVRILEYLGVSVPEPLVVEVGLEQQSDLLSEEWARRYHGIRSRRRIFFYWWRLKRPITRFVYQISATLKKRYFWYGQLIKKSRGSS